MQVSLASLGRDLVEHRLDLLRAVTGADEQRVRGVHDDHVRETDRDHQPIPTMHQHTLRAAVEVLAGGHQRGAGAGAQRLEQRRPRADIGPSRVQGHDCHPAVAGGRLRDAGVDADRGHRLENLAHGADPARYPGQRLDPLERSGKFGLEALHGLPKRVDAPNEDPGVPQVAALLHEPGGRGGVGLFDEALDQRNLAGGVQRLPDLDVAVAGGRMRRHDAQRDQVPALRAAHGLPQGRDEALIVADEVIGWQDERHLVRLATGEDRREPGGNRGGARQRLPQHVVRRQLGELLLGGAHMCLARDDVDVVRLQQRAEPSHGLLQQARLAGQREELLGRSATGERPETGPRPPGHDHREHGGRLHHRRGRQSAGDSCSSRAPSSTVRR